MYAIIEADLTVARGAAVEIARHTLDLIGEGKWDRTFSACFSQMQAVKILQTDEMLENTICEQSFYDLHVYDMVDNAIAILGHAKKDVIMHHADIYGTVLADDETGRRLMSATRRVIALH